MKLSQILTLIYLGLAIAAGYVSNSLHNLIYSLASTFAIYIVSYLALIRTIRHKKKNWLLSNSLITFILVWLVVWIFLFNTR